ncbi:hypothetical protein [Acetobacter orleanensis]|uniref:hypothetical protein n=1 Tax=Acetobacter orleanensis TaxID=104099 RepID=UPI0006622C67|nr:hypothetical protein [Acetobacter orleanensis]KXV66603.1 hypothetical protein AD949_02135 [Acetobacter orleanensis]PCD78453.1 hypothetical protein CO710_12240 [Acetobacter orleanensis]
MEQFDEVVVKNSKKYNGEKGYISGISSDNGKIFSYAVFLFCNDRVVMFSPNELQKTGKKILKKDFFTGETIKITMKGHFIK